MRLIEQVAAMLASVIAKQDGGRLPAAQEDLEEKVRQTAGISLTELKRLSPDAVGRLLAGSGAMRYGRAVIVAELLLHDAAIAHAGGDGAGAILSELHAFCLLADSIDTLSLEDEEVYRPKLERLAAGLRGLSSDPYVAEKLRSYDHRARVTPPAG